MIKRALVSLSLIVITAAAVHARDTRPPPVPSRMLDEFFNNVVVARSTDGGKTWREYQCVTRYKEAPGDLTELSDGTVVLTYGQQNFPYGSRAVVSRDGGRWVPRTSDRGALSSSAASGPPTAAMSSSGALSSSCGPKRRGVFREPGG